MRKIKIAQIGMNSNSHGKQIFQRLCMRPDLFEIVGYALPEGERERIPERMFVFDGYPELSLEQILEDPEIEAVTVETDEIYLTKYALLAAQHGKHIHMEKPGGCSMEAFEALIDTVKKAGTVFHTGYMYRYNPYVMELLDRVKRGELGQIISVEAQMNGHHFKEDRQWLSNLPGGMMFYLGCHLVDLILLLQGTPERIIPLNKCTGVEGVTSQDFGMAVLEYPNGFSFAKTNSTEYGGYARRQLVVTGSLGTVELNPLEEGREAAMHTGKWEAREHDWHLPRKREYCADFDRYETMLASFAKMVRGEMENPYTYDYELTLYKTVLACCGVSV